MRLSLVPTFLIFLACNFWVQGAFADTIRVLMLKSWGATPTYYDIARNSQLYGDDDIRFEYFSGSITPDVLNTKAPHVLLIANPSGGRKFYSVSERDAIEQYLTNQAAARGIVGEGYVFNSIGDTRPKLHFMGRLFGFKDGNIYDPVVQDGEFVIQEKFRDLKLFEGLSSTFQSQGFLRGNIPIPNGWSDDALGSAVPVALARDRQGLITYFDNENFNAIYISVWAGYQSGESDKQLIYNAIRSVYYGEKFGPTITITGPQTIECTKEYKGVAELSLFIEDDDNDPISDVVWTLNNTAVGFGQTTSFEIPMGDSQIIVFATTASGETISEGVTLEVVDSSGPQLDIIFANKRGELINEITRNGLHEVTVQLNAFDLCDGSSEAVANAGVNLLGDTVVGVHATQHHIVLESTTLNIEANARDTSGNTTVVTRALNIID